MSNPRNNGSQQNDFGNFVNTNNGINSSGINHNTNIRENRQTNRSETITRSQRRQDLPDYLNAIVAGILGTNTRRSLGNGNSLPNPTYTLNINNVEIPADVVDRFIRITDMGTRANSSETTIEEIIARRNNLRNGINSVIDTFMELSVSIDNLVPPRQEMIGTSSTVSGSEYKNSSNLGSNSRSNLRSNLGGNLRSNLGGNLGSNLGGNSQNDNSDGETSV